MPMTQSLNLRQTVLREMLGHKEAEARALKPSVPDQDEEFTTWGHMKRGLLFYIKLAQERLERDEYGYCFDCGGEIEEGRLKEHFMYIRCEDCQNLHKAKGIQAN